MRVSKSNTTKWPIPEKIAPHYDIGSFSRWMLVDFLKITTERVFQRDALGDGQPRGVVVVDRVVARVDVPIGTIPRRVFTHETPRRGVVPTGAVILQARGGVEELAGVTEVRPECTRRDSAGLIIRRVQLAKRIVLAMLHDRFVGIEQINDRPQMIGLQLVLHAPSIDESIHCFHR